MTRIFLVLSLLFLSACDAQPGEEPTPGVTAAGLQRDFAGSEMPDLTILSPDGETVALRDVAGGEALLVNLWASWCAPCIQELPTLIALSGREGAPRVLTLSQDMGPQASIRAFLDDKGLVAVDGWQDPEMGMTDALGVQIMPTTILYDAEGREVWRYVGDLDWTGEDAARLLAELD